MAHRPGWFSSLMAVLVVPMHGAVPLDERDRAVVRGNVPAALALAEPVGRPDPGAPMERMILSLRIAPEAQGRLSALLGQQQDPKSPLYHHWLTPEAFGAQFGPSQQSLDEVEGWLKENDFTVEEVGPGRTSIVFSGSVSQVERAFQTLVLDYRLEGRAFHANAVEPSIPRALAGVVHGVVSMHNLPLRAMNQGFRPLASHVQFTTGATAHYMAPGDFAAIYNAKPLYSAGIQGSGVTIAIVGRTHIPLSDITTFRSQFGLPVNPPTFVINGTDPGDLGAGEDGEADLDVEWSGAVAPNAAITFVMSKSTSATDGVDLSAQYAVSKNLAPILSCSFGQCEAGMGASENNFYNNLWAQAAAQGITVFVASGDSGAAGCSAGGSSAGSGQAVSGLASTPYNVAVGGTEFNESGGAYWAAANGTGQASALGYIPEKAWNESGSVSGGSGLWATGGGASSLYGKPAWQTAAGVPNDGRRDLPDVSLSAASHDGYLIQSSGQLQAAGGTSCAAPAFAGLMALVIQATGQRQGNANLMFYKLGKAQFAGTGPAVYHDILSGNNSVPGASGFTCGTGYDLATGLGSVDAHALVANWGGGPANTVTASILAPTANETVASGTAIRFNGAAKDSNSSATLTYAWTFGDGATGTGASPSHTFTNAGTASAAYTVTLAATDSSGVSSTATRVITVTPAPRNTLTASIAAPAATVTVASGAAVAFAGTAKDSSSTAAVSYAWTFGDGATATGASASHAFTNTGTAGTSYTVTLTATDSTGVSSTATRVITVTPAPRNTLAASIPTPAATVTVASGAAVAFAGTAKDSSSTAAVSYAWTFGDGATATGASASHAFTNAGATNATYTVTLTVSDATGATATATRTITVAPAPSPLTAVIASPVTDLTVASGTTLSLTGIAQDTNPNPVFTYTWSGSMPIPAAAGRTVLATTTSLSSVCTATFSNTSTTAYSVTLTFTVSDNKGAKASASRTITVKAAGHSL